MRDQGAHRGILGISGWEWISLVLRCFLSGDMRSVGLF